MIYRTDKKKHIIYSISRREQINAPHSEILKTIKSAGIQPDVVGDLFTESKDGLTLEEFGVVIKKIVRRNIDVFGSDAAGYISKGGTYSTYAQRQGCCGGTK